MKKVLFVLFVFCAAQLTAQTAKEKEKILNKISKSDEEIVDTKKGLDAKTWISRAGLFVEAYDAPISSIIPGMSQMQVKTAMKGEKSRTDNQEINDVNYEILIYSNLKLYFDEKGVLSFWQVIEEITPNPLFRAYESYVKASELDVKKSYVKKINEGLQSVNTKMITEASTAYSLGKYDEALRYFEGSLASTSHPAVGLTDSIVIYNTALIARMAGNKEKALIYYKKLIDIGYEQGGSALASYAVLVREKGDTIQAMDILSNGFVKYPKNQEILIALINAYLTQGDDLSKVLPYIKTGQENEPNNASLYYAEGVVYQNLNNNTKAAECFNKALELDPNNYATQYSVGALFYNSAVEIQNKMSDPSLIDAQYDKLQKNMEDEFERAIPYLTKAYELMPTERAIVESLRSIYYRFQEKSPEMKEKFEFYKKMLETM